MRIHILAGVTLTVIFGTQAAYPQAAAESVLLNSNSAAATAKAGTSMGNALNQAGSKLGNQIQSVGQPRVAGSSVGKVTIVNHKRLPATAASGAAGKPAATGGSLITSIQGGHLSQPSTSPNSSQDKDKSKDK